MLFIDPTWYVNEPFTYLAILLLIGSLPARALHPWCQGKLEGILCAGVSVEWMYVTASRGNSHWWNKQRVLMHRHQGWNVRHGLCHIYMRYLYIYELFIAFVMPPPLGAGGIMFSGCPSIRLSVRPSVRPSEAWNTLFWQVHGSVGPPDQP